jgi:hypothetical protein
MSAAVVGAYGPMLGPGFVVISAELGITVNVLSEATAWLILTLGICVFFFNPLAKIYGKRPVYVFASIILVVVSIWVCHPSPKDGQGEANGGFRALWQTPMEASLAAEFWVRSEWLLMKCWSKLLFLISIL